MFAAVYFARRYFSGRYWPFSGISGGSIAPPGRTKRVKRDRRETTVEADA